MLKRLLPCLLLMGACGVSHPESAPPEWLIGTYQYSGSGRIAKKFPWSAKADLVLDHDGQYTMNVTVHVNDDKGGDTDTEESYGTYRVDGNRLFLQPAKEDKDGDVEEFEIRGRQLVPKIGWPARLALKGFRIPDPVFVKSE